MNPIPTLIVDDEYLIRSLVRNSIDWESLGFSIVGEAEDGEEALRLAEELKPQLMIVDINIPFINGLDLSLRLREAHPDIRIVILTGYEDFQFAHKAIKVGVVDYLLKPINPDELAKAVCAARDGILRGNEENRAAQTEAIRSKEDALRALLSSESPDPGFPAQVPSGLNIDLNSSSIVLCLIDVDPPLPAEALRGLTEFPCELFPYRNGRIAMLANEDPRTIRLKDKAYYSACEAVLGSLVGRGCIVSIGIAPPAESVASLPLAYERAAAALEETFYLGVNLIHAYSEKRADSSAAPKPPTLPSRESMIMRLRSGNEKELVSLVQTLFRDLSRGRAARQYCEMLCLEIMLVLNEYLKDAGLSVNEILETEDDYYRFVRERKTLGEMAAWLTEIIKLSAVAVETQGKTRTHLVVKKAKVFIEKYYAHQNITLEQVAESVAVTASYVSSIFKKEMGLSVIEYLTTIRLEAAKKIMDADPLVTIIEVADRVGYSDPYYFSKCFRKHFGLAPTAYLRRKNLSAPD